MSELESKILFAEEMGGKGRSPELANVRKDVESEARAEAFVYEAVCMPVSPELQRFAEEAKTALVDYFSSCGIPKEKSVFPNKILVFPYVTEDSCRGVAKPEFLAIQDLSISDSELKNYEQSLIILHELYHSAAPEKYWVKRDKHGPIAAIDRLGLAYIPGSSLEEGLASIVTARLSALSRKKFPQGAALRDKLVKERLEKLSGTEMDKRILNILSHVDTYANGEAKIGLDPYVRSTTLTAGIEEDVPGFSHLAERARILGDTIAFARALEKVYGPGSYRDIALATEETANQSLELLVEKKRQRDFARVRKAFQREEG